MEKVLLSIGETLKEFRSMLLVAKIHIFAHHKNPTFENLTIQRVLRWRSHFEEDQEDSPKIYYTEGENDIVTDNLSHLNCLPSPTEVAEASNLVHPSTEVEADKLENYFDKDEIDEFHAEVTHSGVTDPHINDMLDSYLTLLEMKGYEENPLNFAHISEMQQADNQLLTIQQNNHEQ